MTNSAPFAAKALVLALVALFATGDPATPAKTVPAPAAAAAAGIDAKTPASPAAAEVPQEADRSLLARPRLEVPEHNPFAVARPIVAVQPAPPVVVQTPVRVAAPPVPFVYFGRVERDDALRVFLVGGQRLYEAKVGDVLEESYRVEQITESEVLVTYLPLDERQAIPIR